MEITYISNNPIPSKSAPSVHIMKMCNAFAQNGHIVNLIAPESDNSVTNDEIFDFYAVSDNFNICTISKIELPKFGTFLYNYFAAREAIATDPDLIYGRSIISCYFSSFSNYDIISEVHTPIKTRKHGKIENIFFRRLIARENFSNLVVITNSLVDYYEQEYETINRKKIILARDGADPVSRNTSSIGINKPKEFNIGYTGQFTEGKGITRIYKLSQKMPDIYFHVFGGDDKEVKEWQRKTRGQSNITFHGFQSQKDINGYRLAMDALIAPYDKQVMTSSGHNIADWMSPLKIFEYMATGRPIVASDLPAIREILEDGETALLCNPDDISEWVESISTLIDEEHLRNELARNALDQFENNYTWQKRAQKILAESSNI